MYFYTLAIIFNYFLNQLIQSKMKKFAKFFIGKYGINNYIAVKNQLNNSVGSNYFYKAIKIRLKYYNSERLSTFLMSELIIHYKEFAQYQ